MLKRTLGVLLLLAVLSVPAQAQQQLTPSQLNPNSITINSTSCALGGSCTISGGGSGTVNSGTIGQLGYYAASGTAISGESLVTLTQGGTNAALTASNGGIVYSGASALAILAGTSTAGQCLLSGNLSAPTWGSCSGGSGTVNSGTSGQVAYYGATGTAVSGEALSALLDSSIGSTQGDILYRSASAWSVLAPGTSGFFLETQGASANPTWAAASGGSGCSTGGSAGNLLTANGSGGCTTDTSTSLTNGALSLGSSGTPGSVVLGNATSGTITLQPQTGALGSVTLTFPAITDTLVTLTATQTLTNKAISGASNTLSNIGNSALTNSTISGVSLGSNLNTLTFGTHLASGGTSYNGSAAVTITSDATNANTASTIVARDASGNFTAGTITAALTGTASNASALGGATFAAPGPVGSTTAGTGAFTTLSASSTVNGAGFTSLFASPPAIGGTAAAAGSFTTLSATTSITDTALNVAGVVTNTSGGALGTTPYATAAQVQAGTSTTNPVTPSALAASAAFQTLTYGTTVNWNMQSGYNATLTLTGSTSTIAAPTNIVAGLTYTLLLVQDATGSRTTTFNAAFDFGTAGTPTLTTTANKTDAISCLAASTSTLYCTIAQGF